MVIIAGRHVLFENFRKENTKENAEVGLHIIKEIYHLYESPFITISIISFKMGWTRKANG